MLCRWVRGCTRAEPAHAAGVKPAVWGESTPARCLLLRPLPGRTWQGRHCHCTAAPWQRGQLLSFCTVVHWRYICRCICKPIASFLVHALQHALLHAISVLPLLLTVAAIMGQCDCSGHTCVMYVAVCTSYEGGPAQAVTWVL